MRVDVVRAIILIKAFNCKCLAGEIFHVLDPIDESIRPRCRPLAEPSELVDIVDNAYHGLIRNEISAPRRHGCTSSSNDAGGMLDGEQPLKLAAQAQPVASLDEGQHPVAKREGLQQRLALGRLLSALGLGRRRRSREMLLRRIEAAGQFPDKLEARRRDMPRGRRVGVDESILNRGSD